MTDYYRERFEELCAEITGMYEHAVGALEAVEPDTLERLTLERQQLFAQMRELSIEDFFGRGQESWLTEACQRVYEAEQVFERRLRQEFEAQREQMRSMGKSRKARRAYGSAA